MDATQGSEASKSLLGPLNGKFSFKKNEDGTINKNVVICSICKKEFSYHRSSYSLTYHLNAKHVRTSSTVTGASVSGSSLRQNTDLQEAFQIAASDPSLKLPSRATVMKRIHQLYDDERDAKEELLAGASHVTTF